MEQEKNCGAIGREEDIRPPKNAGWDFFDTYLRIVPAVIRNTLNTIIQHSCKPVGHVL